MNVYDELGGEYDRYRSEVGAHVVLEVVHEMGEGLHVMDLGCGTGHPIAIRVAPLASRYLGVDSSAPMLSAFRTNVVPPDKPHPRSTSPIPASQIDPSRPDRAGTEPWAKPRIRTCSS